MSLRRWVWWKADLFNLTVRDTSPGGRTQKFLNLTAKNSSRRIDSVLEAESALVRYDGTVDPNTAIAAGMDAS